MCPLFGGSAILSSHCFDTQVPHATLVSAHAHSHRVKGTRNIRTSATVTDANTKYYENVEIQPPTATAGGEDNMYEHVELRSITTQQKEETEVVPNAAYVTVQR